jgi:hypothetical protein
MYKQPPTIHLSTQALSGDKRALPDRRSAFRSAFDFQGTGTTTFQSAFDFVDRATPSRFRSAFDWLDAKTPVVSAFDVAGGHAALSALANLECAPVVKSAFDFE